jgi:hypothetical protein
MTTKKKAKAKRPAKVSGAPLLSDVQRKVVALMSREKGATKAQLVEALPDNKAGYVSALLHRILRDKGIKFKAEYVAGQRQVVYRID